MGTFGEERMLSQRRCISETMYFGGDFLREDIYLCGLGIAPGDYLCDRLLIERGTGIVFDLADLYGYHRWGWNTG
jgi:hypothetical protein